MYAETDGVWYIDMQFHNANVKAYNLTWTNQDLNLAFKKNS